MSSLSPRVLVLSPRLRASSCRRPRPGPCGAAAATAAIAAASLAMWLHFVRAPAPAAPALLLLRRRRLPPARPLGAAGGSAELPPPATCGPGAAVQARPRGPREGARSGELRAGRERWTDRLPRCCCPARRRRRGPLTGSLAPSAALTHVLLTEQNPNYSPALPPTSATLSHWAAGLFRRNNKTCQSGEGQRVTETRLGGRGARRAAERARPGKAGGRGRGGTTRRDPGDAGDAARERVPRLGTTPACPARGDAWSRPRRASGIAFPGPKSRPSETYFPRNGSLPVRVEDSFCRREVDFTQAQRRVFCLIHGTADFKTLGKVGSGSYLRTACLTPSCSH